MVEGAKVFETLALIRVPMLNVTAFGFDPVFRKVRALGNASVSYRKVVALVT